MDIITGYEGKPHIKSDNDRDIHIGIVGDESYVMNTGQMLKAEVSTNNEVKIRDGLIMHQGCAASIKKNTYDSLRIINGSQGMKRTDLIVARYKRAPEDNNRESMELIVLKGEPNETNPVTPSHMKGSIQDGDAVVDMPLYEVKLDGLNIIEVKKVFETMTSLSELNSNLSAESKNIDDIQSKLCGLGQRIVVGRYTPTWKVGSQYYNMGNKIPDVNNEYYISRYSSSSVDIKKAGTYLIIVNFPFVSTNSATLWVSVRNKGKEIKNAQCYSYNGYATVNLALIAELNEWDYIECYVSATGEAQTTGSETMEIVKLV